jgi:hypothetical protein
VLAVVNAVVAGDCVTDVFCVVAIGEVVELDVAGDKETFWAGFIVAVDVGPDDVLTTVDTVVTIVLLD